MTRDPFVGRDRSATAVLDLTIASGLWVVASSSPTRYFVDVQGLLLRSHGVGSPRFAFDDEWVPLVRVRSYDPTTRESTANEIRCGARAYYLTDPRGGSLDYEWRLQRVVTEIRPLAPDDAAAMYARTAAPDVPLRPEWARTIS
ncbi:hypothetical protein [Cellulomonas sp. GbtcB1]|uniref:hypothetical protein n=1 Tax=Cellulomonas sp. GbtcB1 TaxID=2824746 RepID=UPI001C2FC868|nr:hypothetical protein [Cellulomonas sp. GbtcB1]